MVSSSSYPLAGVFLLKKGDRHRVHEGRPSLLAAELLSRAIVPYYLAKETQEVLEVLHHLASLVPLRELEFLAGGWADSNSLSGRLTSDRRAFLRRWPPPRNRRTLTTALALTSRSGCLISRRDDRSKA